MVESNVTDNIDYPAQCMLSLILNHESMDLYYKSISDFRINQDDFVNPELLQLFNIIVLVATENNKISKDIILDKIKTKKLKYTYNTILDLEVAVDNFTYFCEKVKNNSSLLKIKNYCLTTLTDLRNFEHADFEIKPGDLIDGFENISLGITNNIKQNFVSPSDIIPDLFNIIRNGEPLSVLQTPFETVNETLNGLPNEYMMLGARPSAGKSAMGLQLLVHNAVTLGHTCAMFSLEMSTRQLGMRALAQLSGVELSKIRKGDLTAEELVSVESAAKRFGSSKIHIDPTPGLTAQEICARAQRFKIKYPDLQFIVIDHLQKINRGDNELMGLTKASNMFFNLRKKLDIPVLLLLQLNRNLESDNRKNKRPGLPDMRGAGTLEEDGGVIMFLHSDNYFDPHTKGNTIWQSELIIAKNRDGALQTVDLKFNRATQTFEE